MEKNLIIVLGVSGSGKTTYCKELIKDLKNWSYFQYDEVSAELRKSGYTVETQELAFNNLIREELSKDDIQTVIVDNPLVSREDRKRLLEVMPKDINVKLIFLAVSLENLKKRTRSRYWDDYSLVENWISTIIENSYNQLEFPTLEELSGYTFKSVNIQIIDNN